MLAKEKRSEDLLQYFHGNVFWCGENLHEVCEKKLRTPDKGLEPLTLRLKV